MSLLKDKKIVYEYNVDHTEGLVEVIEKIPDDLFNKLKKIIKNKSVKVNSALAGQIEEEYEINDAVPFFEKFLLEKIINNKKLMTDCNARYQILDKNLPIYLRRMWVNYQKKHEFNPVHKHDGIFTFILFIPIITNHLCLFQCCSSTFKYIKNFLIIIAGASNYYILFQCFIKFN